MPSYEANGNITPASFVKFDGTSTSKKKVILAAAATDTIAGISQVGSRYAFPGLDDGFAAIAGENIHVWTSGDTLDFCYLRVGGAVNPGDYLTSDASGFGIATVVENNTVGAVAMEIGASGDLIKVRPMQFMNV